MTIDKKNTNSSAHLFGDNSKTSDATVDTPNKMNSNRNSNRAKGDLDMEKQAKPKKEPEVKSVYITISGATYPINCPVDEQEDLDKAVRYINHFIREVRSNAPTLPHDQLLVLCCLNMYEEMNQQKDSQDSIRASDKQMSSLIEKIIKDAKSIL